MRSPDPVSGNDLPQVQLRLLATTDLHAHALPWDDLADRPAPDRGLAQVASLIAAARAEVAGSVLLDNGDFLNGSPLADHVAETPRRAAAHPMIAAMNQLGYDAATLGNHEFSNGLPLLRRALSQARFAVVATNLDRIVKAAGGKAGRRPFLPRQALISRDLIDQFGQSHRITIGILGFLPPQTALWERRHMAGRLAARGILDAARQAAPLLRRAGADVVIALAHSGLGTDQTDALAENVSRALSNLPGIDAVVAGHTHQLYPAPQDPQPCDRAMVMPGFFGSHLGVLDLTLQRGAQGWRRLSYKAELRPISQRLGPQGTATALVAGDPTIQTLMAADIAAMRRASDKPVGQTETPLHSWFALIGHSPVQTLLAEAQVQHMAQALRGTPEARLPLLAAIAPFKAGGRGGPGNYTAIAPGPVTARNVADLYIHPNTPVALRLTGAELALWLERAVSLFHQIHPGQQDQPLIDTRFPAYNFDMIHGLDYCIDLSEPPRFGCDGMTLNPGASRIRDLCLDGRPIDPDASFILATNSYRAAGGAGFAGTDHPCVVMEESRPLRRVLQDHIARAGRISPPAAMGWSFVPMPGTSVIFDSAPEAAAHAHEIPGLTALGLQPTGFLRFRLRL
ncbi:MAG: bifunctional 2',3'-cyclic-nucleotide 2'-phosphodiesterase/3'-nucleotidase [Pseudorhodobacter sp.]|nr:MAG: bifunctional 2',3'-cyclic-nucleotide 2'-phosphodiesterase/3'-nucleotidase [Pseudorhodobacter sp.]